MSKEEAFQWYYRGCKDTDYIDERTYFEQTWRRVNERGSQTQDDWID